MSDAEVSEKTYRPLEHGRLSLTEFDQTLEASITSYMLLAEQDEFFTGDRWSKMVRRSGGLDLDLIHLDFTLEHASAERDKGFPILYSHAVVGGWSAIEIGINDFAAAWLRDYAPALSSDLAGQIEMPVAEVLGRSRSEVAETVLRRLDNRLRSSQSGQRVRPGVEPFMRLLSAVGIHFELDEDVVEAVNEMAAVRNQMVHKGGTITERFLDLCPRFASVEGATVQTDHQDWANYYRRGVHLLDQIEEAARTIYEAWAKAEGR